jgi:uncharacterized protein YqfA (UPF0365 family)
MNAAPPGNGEFPVMLLLFVFVVFGFVLLLGLVLMLTMVRPWMRGFVSGAPVSLVQILGMRLRGVPPLLIVDALATLVHRGHPFNSRLSAQAESLFLAQRGLIRSPEHLADLVEKQLKAA